MARHSSKLASFQLSTTQSDKNEARLGSLSFQGRNPIDTPHYVAVSSRGAVPHLSQDMMRDNSSIHALYAAVEDFIEKASLQSQVPPAFNFPASPDESPLRKFIALQKDALLILGTRRIPPLPCVASGTSSAISIVTSLGFGMLEVTDYVEAVQKLRPDIAVSMGDVLFGHIPGVKRKDVMGDRTLAWLRELISTMETDDGIPRTALFAPILPIDAEQQAYYLDALQDDLSESVSGLALYDFASVDAIPENLRSLPRLSLGDATSPHKLLDAMALGIDAFTVPFITEATDAGIALNFSFPAQSEIKDEGQLPLGIDMWSTTFATDISPLLTDCRCYTCTNHHRAFVHHLLNAKEMLGWVLLQLHNHHIVDEFFIGARESIKKQSFEGDSVTFEKIYAMELPAKTGQGPRIRGYQFKTEGKGGPRKNPMAYRPFDDGKDKLAEATLPSPKADAEDLEQQGFAKKVE